MKTMNALTNLSAKKAAILLAGIFFVGAAGTVLYKSSTEDSGDSVSTSTTTTISSEIEGKIKQDATTISVTTTTVPPASGTPTTVTSLKSLAVSVTATKSVTDEVISTAFYLEGGTYTVQEKNSGEWRNVLENYAYPGSGGLVAGELKAGENSKIFRILRNETGRYTASSKEFTVSREEVTEAGGIKTYN